MTLRRRAGVPRRRTPATTTPAASNRPTLERMQRLVGGDGRPAAAVPGHPRHRHQRQGLDDADDHPAADGPRPDRRHLHQPAPRAAQRAHRPQRRADQRRRLRRADRRDRRPRGASPACARRYFEAVTAAAFRWFADIAVDVAVVEVGLLGRWDATNVVDAQVAVVTNIGARPHRVRRADDGRHRPREGRHRQAGQRGGDRRDRPRARRRSSSTPAARRTFVRGERLRRASRTSWRSAGGWSTCARRPRSTRACSCRCTAGTRPTTPRSRSPRSRRSSPRRSPTTSSREGFAEVRDAGPLRGARPPAARHRRRRPQPGRRRHVRGGVLRRLRPGRPAHPRGRLPAGPRPGRDAVGAARRRVRRRAHAAPRRRRAACRPPSSPRRRATLGCDEVIECATVEQACRPGPCGSPAPTTPSSSPARCTWSAPPAPRLRKLRRASSPTRRAAGSVCAAMSDRTLVLLKPDAVERGLVGEIVGRFEAKDLHDRRDGPAHARRRHAGPPLRRARRQGLLRRPGRVHEPRPGRRAGGRGPGGHVGGRPHA